MRVFLSWSGIRSRALAEAVHQWLPNVMQAVEPWMSSEDLEKGSRWFHEVGSELAQSEFGVICVTPENQHAPWLLFEAGALSKTIEQARVATVLLDIGAADVSGPLANFQHTSLAEEDVRRLVASINRRLERPLPDAKVASSFEKWWPELRDRIEAARQLASPPAVSRPDRDPVAGDHRICSRQRSRTGRHVSVG